MVKLSFIVPVYNVAPYLRKCVDSLLAQDYGSYEIILVDDGSTDGSGELCDEIVRANDGMSRNQNDEPKVLNEPHLQCSMSRDKSLNDGKINLNEPLSLNDGKPQIQVIHQENGGLSSARNAGLMAAKGEYVCFVDSDDYWEENVLGGLMEQVEREELDVLRFDYRNVRLKVESGKSKVERGEYEVFEPNKNPHHIDRCMEIVDGETYLNERMSYACYAVMFIVRRSLLVYGVKCKAYGEDCLFREGMYFEDTEWTPRMMVRAKRVASTDTIVYNYLVRQGSITKKYDKEHIRKKNDSLMQVNISLQHLHPMVKDGRWIRGCIADNVHNILNNAATYDYESVSSLVKTIKEHRMLPLQGYEVRKISLIRYKLINMSPRLYCWLRHVRMKYL